jgi:nucleoside-diphosphate-sugar epimerase
MKKLRLLVTGGAGYLGSVMVPELLAAGYHVTVVDNLMYKQCPLLDCCICPDFEFVRGDVRDKTLMEHLVKDADYVLPLAAIVGAPACDKDPVSSKTVNLDAIKLMNELRDVQQRVLLPMTNSGYGTKSGEVFCTEDTPLEPISLYGSLKVKAENELLSKGNTISLRLATVFGLSPRMRLDLLVNDFTFRAVSDGFMAIYQGEFKRNYIHIRDVARAFVYCIERFDEMKDESYNVGLNEANLSKIELARKIQEYVPSLHFHCAKVGDDPDKRNYIVSNEKINRKGFYPKYSLDHGIQELIKGYQIILGIHTSFTNR